MEHKEKIRNLTFSEFASFYSKSLDWNQFTSNTKLEYFHINRLESYILTSPLPPHRKPLFDFIYIKKGYNKRSKGLTNYEIGESSMFFLPPNQITQYEIMSKDTEGFFCHFDEQLFHFLPKKFLADNYPFFQFQAYPIVKLSDTTMKNVGTILERLLIINEDEVIGKIILATYLLTLFEEVKNELPAQPQKIKNASMQITELYKNALVKHIYEKQYISDYSHLLNISSNHLNKCVIDSINMTAQDLLNEMLILEAKTLLKYTNLQIAEIAIKLRNQTPSNFTRFFKTQTGITPKEYINIR
jgi:AraC-like DNA-binding protein